MSSSIILSDNGVTSGVTGITQTAGNDGTLLIKTSTSGGTATTAVTFDNSQNTTLAGNLTFASGKGLTFNNSSALTNSQLNDYETGTWTPTDASGAGLTLTNNYAHYTKVGNLVTVTAYITWPSTTNTSAPVVGGLPFSGVSNGYATGIVSTNMNNSTICLTRYQPTGTTFYVNPAAGNGSLGNNNLSTAYVIFTMTYQANF